MNIKVVIVILAVACAGLGIALFATKKQADDQHSNDVTSINDFSNQVVTANKHLEELGQVNLALSNNLSSSELQLTLTADQMTQFSNSLTAASATLADTKTSLTNEEQLVINLNNRIADLENQNKALDVQADSMSNTLAHLTQQIEDTRNQLAVSETNATFLQGELRKQLAEKAELEHKFNDLTELRTQVRKIKDEMFVARRLQLMKNDTGNKKGGEVLINHTTTTNSTSARLTPPNYDLNVEIGSDGSVKVIPPLGGTNSPASVTGTNSPDGATGTNSPDGATGTNSPDGATGTNSPAQ